MTEIQDCLSRTLNREECRKMSFARNSRMEQVGFEPIPRRSQSRRWKPLVYAAKLHLQNVREPAIKYGL